MPKDPVSAGQYRLKQQEPEAILENLLDMSSTSNEKYEELRKTLGTTELERLEKDGAVTPDPEIRMATAAALRKVYTVVAKNLEDKMAAAGEDDDSKVEILAKGFALLERVTDVEKRTLADVRKDLFSSPEPDPEPVAGPVDVSMGEL